MAKNKILRILLRAVKNQFVIIIFSFLIICSSFFITRKYTPSERFALLNEKLLSPILPCPVYNCLTIFPFISITLMERLAVVAFNVKSTLNVLTIGLG